jgi:D-amino peptidase
LLDATARRILSAARARPPQPTSVNMRQSGFPSLIALLVSFAVVPAQAQRPPRYFISVDMEGIGGIGTPAMTSPTGKDYELGRKLMTDEVNAVVGAILQRGPAEILVNDSHGDMQNLLHTELDPRVIYIQGAVKPFGMVEGLDSTYAAAIFLGYHSRAGTPNGFIAHTGTGAVKGLWLNDIEVGEGELNAAYAGSVGVPVIMAAGDSAFVEQFTRTVKVEAVATKYAVTPQSARLLHPKVVQERLVAAAGRALASRSSAKPWVIGKPVKVRLRLADNTVTQILQAIPGVRQVDGYTVEFTAPTMADAYRLIRLMYRFVSV